MISKKFCRLCLFVILGAHLVSASILYAAEKKMKPGDAGVVNGKSITVIELEKRVDAMVRQFAAKGKAPDQTQIAQIRKSMLEELIGIELLSQEVKKKGIKVEEGAVAGRFQALKSSFPDEKGYREALAKDKITEDGLKKRIEEGLLMQELLSREVIQKISISSEESRTFYDSNPDAFKQPEQVHASHILMKVDPQAGDAAKMKAREEMEEILKKLKKGEDFAALAKQHSQCPSNVKGGDLGIVSRGQTVKPFEDAAFSLKPGETSGIVETEFGFHIVRVTEKREGRVVPYEEAEEALKKHLKDAKIKEEVSRYIDGLKAKSKVERNL